MDRYDRARSFHAAIVDIGVCGYNPFEIEMALLLSHRHLLARVI
jgi:hypothetical protein